MAFTDISAGSMSTSVPEGSAGITHRAAVRGELGLDQDFQFMHQVHGAKVVELDEHSAQPEADGLISSNLPLAVLVADCVPILLLADTDDGKGLAAAVHAGRKGLGANIVAGAVQALGERGGSNIAAWIGPAICAECYEVPEAMRAEMVADFPAAFAQTSWGTPSIDLRAGVTSQLTRLDVEVNHIAVCTLEEPRLFSHRRAEPIGRFAGLVYRTNQAS